MKVTELALPGVMLIEPTIHGDQRGFLFEAYHEARYKEAGISGRFVQDNQSRSAFNVLRGLHFQIAKPQGKLVRVISGEIFDVAADINPASSTYGHWVSATLDSVAHHQLYVPPGYAHGFLVMSESAEVHYKCTDFYDPADEGGIAWNDPLLEISWPSPDPQLSQKDQQWPVLAP